MPNWSGVADALGAIVEAGGTRFAVWAPDVAQVELVLEDRTVPLARDGEYHAAFVAGIGHGDLYNFRVDGALLADPYALAIDRPYGVEMPRCTVTALPPPLARETPRFAPGGLIYELNVRAFTMLHPEVPAQDRGRIAALAHPAVIAHLKALGVSAVELMPIVAWIDERHLHALGLTNSWGYNPVTFMPIDPRLGTLDDLRATVAALHAAGIGVILDLVFNHSGESDVYGQTLCFRGLAERHYFRHAADGSLVNDTGCGNTIDCDHPMMRRMVRDALRHFVTQAGIDGFRFDLAPVLGDTLIAEMLADPVLADRVFIAEPRDLASYRLGRFPSPFLEWNDRYRTTLRRFWRGDSGQLAELGYGLSGSSDFFKVSGRRPSASINYVACHDGFTLADVVSYERKHNASNGEDNRDGTDDNHSFNGGVEGPTADPSIEAFRQRSARNLLASVFLSIGTPMLLAGDELGRTQKGNNNAYCQDNEVSWVDWNLTAQEQALLAFTQRLVKLRFSQPVLQRRSFFLGASLDDSRFRDLVWFHPEGHELGPDDWRNQELRCFGVFLGGDALTTRDPIGHRLTGDTLLIYLNAAYPLTQHVI